MVEDRFLPSIEKNEHLVELYYHIIEYFKQQHPGALISYTKSYVGIKFKKENNRCWFKISGLGFEFRFRKNIQEESLEDNMISFHIETLHDFNHLVPFIVQKMNRELQDHNCLHNSGRILTDIINDNTDIVKIYSTGSCNPQTGLGSYSALLQYKSHYKALHGDLVNTTANKCIITGLIEAVKLLKKPSKVKLVTSTSIGVESAIKNGKGTNADIVKVLLKILEQKQCEAESIVIKGEGQGLNNYIFSQSKLLKA